MLSIQRIFPVNLFNLSKSPSLPSPAIQTDSNKALGYKLKEMLE